ncbi:MAG: hypothetical protein OEU26_21790 [Candidatus Tectomicrobia bacterium]|nr:hypothetical protein [Candidatus Tectomicrobia bacterium]
MAGFAMGYATTGRATGGWIGGLIGGALEPVIGRLVKSSCRCAGARRFAQVGMAPAGPSWRTSRRADRRWIT